MEGLTKEYKDVAALKGVTLEVGAGELFAYLGPNGAGKTTTIRILTGLTKRTGGDAWLNGFHIEGEKIEAKRQCGLAPQSVNLDPELTVFENLDVHGRLFGMKRADRKRRIDELLDYIGLSERRDSPVKQLSGGMKRRATIARALVHKPRVLFLDEPTVGLDATIRRRIWALIKKIQEAGATIFLTTHYIEEAEFLADRVAFLDEGEIVTADTPRNLIDAQGAWAIDRPAAEDMQPVYFDTRQAARDYMAEREASYTLRRVNLEDAFLAATGKKVK
ncbi:MAG: ABC transporter ATP-binding protein [Desulfococcaceae bacterium]